MCVSSSQKSEIHLLAQVCLHDKVAVLQAYSDELRSAWDSYVHNHPSGSPFHLIGWKRSVETTYGFESRYLLAEERGEVSGFCPCSWFQIQSSVVL